MIPNQILVVGGDHHNTLWVVRSLGMAGYRSNVAILCDKKRSFVLKSKYIDKGCIVESEDALLGYLRTKAQNNSCKTIMICCCDQAVDIIDRHYDELKANYIMPNIRETQGEVFRYMDKFTMIQCAEDAGFLVPKTLRIDLRIFNKNSIDLDSVVYPCIIKPEISSRGSKHNFKICHSRDELIRDIESLKCEIDEVLIQQYIKPDYEVAIHGVSLPNAHQNIIPGLLYKNSTCESTYNMGMLTYASVLPSITPWVNRSVVDRFFQLIPFRGLYSIEFFVKDENVYFLEINMRTDCDMFIYTAAGVNLPLLWITDCARESISELPVQVQKKTYGMTEISYFKYLHWSRIPQMFRDLFRAKCFSIWNRRDWKPFFYKFYYFVGEKL